MNSQTSRINQCHDLTENPWIQHYRSSSKQRSTVPPSLQESVSTSSKVADLGQRKGIPSGSGHLHLCESRVCHKDMLSSDTGDPNSSSPLKISSSKLALLSAWHA